MRVLERFQPPIRVGQAEPRQSTSVLGRDDGLLEVPQALLFHLCGNQNFTERSC